MATGLTPFTGQQLTKKIYILVRNPKMEKEYDTVSDLDCAIA